MEITPERLEELVRVEVRAALPAHVMRGIARGIVRRQIGVVTLDEAARWLKWENPEALRRKLSRAGVPKVKTSGTKLAFRVEDLRMWRDSCVVRPKSRKVVPMRRAA